MKQKNRIQIISVIICLLIVSTTALPATATACKPCAQSIRGTDILDNFTIESETGFKELNTLLRVITDTNTTSVIEDLQYKDYKLQYDKASIKKIYPKENKSQVTLLVVIPAESKNNNNSAQVVFVYNRETTKVANAVIEKSNNYTKINVHEIDNGIEENYVVENREGTVSIDGKTITSKQQASSDLDCDTCITVCEYIYAAGCGLTGYFTCLGACACFTGPAAEVCLPICAVVWAVICLYGSNNSCPIVCQNYC